MNKKKRMSALVTTVLFAISGAAAGGAQAATNVEASKLAIGSGLGPGLPLSPLSQDNAVRKATEYLQVGAFSHKGLIEQLEYDSFSEDDATSAVDSITVDWNEQAAKKAKNYLDIQGFSHSGLVSQLEYDGFTSSQAEYGVAAAGL
jgi:hypothetical protein